jgi:hypothetical protein
MIDIGIFIRNKDYARIKASTICLLEKWKDAVKGAVLPLLASAIGVSSSSYDE